MKKSELVFVICGIILMFWSCSTPKHQYKAFNFKNLDKQDRRLQNMSNWAIRKALKESDTLYLYGVTFNEWRVLWYHTDAVIHSCIIYPNRIKWQNPIEAKNITVDSVSINKTFVSSFYKNVPCFEDDLDGEFVYMILDKEVLFSSINLECLFAHDFPSGSITYKLKYDLSRLFMGSDTIIMTPSPLN